MKGAAFDCLGRPSEVNLLIGNPTVSRSCNRRLFDLTFVVVDVPGIRHRRCASTAVGVLQINLAKLVQRSQSAIDPLSSSSSRVLQ